MKATPFAAVSMSVGARSSLVVLLALGMPARGRAEPRQQPAPEDILPLSELDDPIGLDQESRDLQAPPKQQPARREPIAPAPRVGEVLTAIPGTREISHAVEVALSAGHALIHVELQFITTSQRPSELLYRLAVPDSSQISTLEVCHAQACRAGLAAEAEVVSDKRGRAILLRAGPLTESLPLTLRVSYVCEAPLHGGVVRLTLPARGMDPQVAPSEVRLTTDGLLSARVGNDSASDAPATFDPWREVSLSAQSKPGERLHAQAWQFACDQEQGCASAQLWAGQRPAASVDLVIALDVSPSTEGPARGRLVSTIAALLAALPEGSRVRALAFASRATTLIEQPQAPAEVALAPFSDAIHNLELGSATRFEVVWELVAPWLKQPSRSALRPLITIVGDGGVTVGHRRAFDLADAAGVEVSVINVADRQTLPALRSGAFRTGGVVLDIGAEAEAAARGRAAHPLDERLSALFAPTLVPHVHVIAGNQRIDLGPLRAGEQLAWQGAARGQMVLRYGASQRSRRPRDETQSAVARSLGAPSPKHDSDSSSKAGIGMPSDPLLDMLRRRILPVARGCFRRDRAGRAQYQKRAVFAFTLAEREITAATVLGNIPKTLQSCLLTAVDTLEVPRFTGVVQVRYPLITESVPIPEQIELKAQTAGAIDQLFP